MESPFAYQQKEFTMLKRTFSFSFAAVAVFLLLLCANCPAIADEVTLTITATDLTVLGQDSKSPGFGTQVKRWFNNLLRDDEPEHTHSNGVTQTAPPAMPTQPPKPPTAAEVREAVATPNPNQRRTAGTPQHQRENASINTRIADPLEENGEDTDSVYIRLAKMREPVFAGRVYANAATAAAQRQQPESVRHTPPPVNTNPANSNLFNVDNGQYTITDSVDGQTTDVPKTQAPVEERAENLNPVRTPLPRSDRVVQDTPDTDSSTLTPSQRAAQRIAALDEEREREREQERRLIVSPRIELETETPSKIVVGQEATYRIRVTNTGNAPAEQVVLTAEIPSWLEVRQSDASNGKVVILPRADNPEMSDMTWKISRLDNGAADLLVLRLIPQQRKSVELRIKYDFQRPIAVAKVEVQEPKLEMELQGPDEVLWNSDISYTLIVRNVGNGDAEGVKFKLLQTNLGNHETQEPLLLKPGDVQEITVKVQTGKQQEHIDIAILATGQYDLKSEVKRRIKVLRPELEIAVQAPDVHFVNNPAEFILRIRNTGSADARNLTIQAELPLGAQYAESSNSGTLIQNNVVEWKGKSIPVGAVETLSLVCVPKREGNCRLLAVVNDPGGELAAGSGAFDARAIVEFDLKVEKPLGPVGLGQDAGYTLHITNIGTKAAENVEVMMAFGQGLEPVMVEGCEAVLDNGQVIFDKIPTIPAGQKIKLHVKAKADQAGTAKIHVEVTGKDLDSPLINVLSTYIYGTQKETVTAAGQTGQLN